MTGTENLDDWADRVASESRARQGLSRYADDPVALDHLAVLLTSATPSPVEPLAPAGGLATGEGIGAVGPRDDSSALGEVRAATVGPSASGRPAAPATSKQAATAGSSGKTSRRSPLKKEA